MTKEFLLTIHSLLSEHLNHTENYFEGIDEVLNYEEDAKEIVEVEILISDTKKALKQLDLEINAK
jgi:hypothetical protein